MLNLKETKKKIQALSETEKIVSAMQATALSKINSAQRKITEYNAFMRSFKEIFLSVFKTNENPIFQKHENGETIYIVITSDKGLCGSFHSELFKKFFLHSRRNQNHHALVIGKKGHSFFRQKENILINKKPIFNREDINITYFRKYVLDIKNLFLVGYIKNVYLVYNNSKNALEKETKIERILPITRHIFEEQESPQTEYIYDESKNRIISELIVTFIESKIFGAMLKSKACEHQERQLAMKKASDNCKKLFEKLTLEYNRARQGQITSELIDIVNGS